MGVLAGQDEELTAGLRSQRAGATLPPMHDDAFFVAETGGFRASEHTRGPWSNEHQHAGPPAALLARAFAADAGDMAVVRISYELLRPIPIALLQLQTRELRPGRRVRLLGATLECDGTELVRATALCVRRKQLDFELPADLPPVERLPAPERCEPYTFPFFMHDVGYHNAMELRIGRGGIGHGHAAAWLRMRHPLIAGEEPTPLERLTIAADSGNGVSAALDHERYLFINPDLTVHVHRFPEGDWIGLDARTWATREGYGVADDCMHDQRGPVGRAVQSLLVDVLG